MSYTIGKTQRNLMLLSAASLTVYSIYNAFFFLGLKPSNVEPNMAHLIIRDLLFAVPYIYLLIILFDYFRHHEWKVLQYIVLLTAIFEIVTNVISMNQLIASSNHYYMMFRGVFWFTVIILQSIFLLRLKRKEHPEVFALQKYAVALILFQIIAFGIPLLFRSESISSMMLVIRIISGIPYLFLVDFTLRLKSKEKMVSESSVNS